MAKFRYKAYTTQGAVTGGTIVADRLEAAIDALYGSGLTPFETLMVSDRDADRVDRNAAGVGDGSAATLWNREIVKSSHFGLKALAAFTSELASLVNSGLTLDAAFRIIAGPGAAPKTIRLANGLLKDVLGGLQLSEAMAQRPEIFPADYRAILAAGEAGGAAGQVLTQIAELLARRLEIRSKVSTALIYPAVLLLMSMVSVLVIAFVLIPSISPIFSDAGLPLPGILNTLVSVQENWPTLLLGLGLGVLTGAMLWRRARQNPRVVLALDRFTCAIPVLGRLVETREAGRFARALGTLLGARVPLMTAMQTARALVTNRHLNLRYELAINRIPEGTALHHAFADTGLLPAASLRMIAVGEESGRLGAMLIQIAGVIETDLQRHIERMVGMLTPLLTLVVGSSIGALIMHVMGAVLSINDLAFQ